MTESPPKNQRGKFSVYCRQDGLWPREVSAHDPLTEREWFKPYCPACNVTAQYPPTVLIHGTADNDVLCDGAVKMDEALTQANVPHKLVTITGGRQAFGGSPEIARVFGSALAFVEEPMGT